MVRLIIKGTQFVLSQEQKGLMKYFEECEALSNENNQVYQLDVFSPIGFQRMLDLMTLTEFNFPDFPAIKTNQLQQVIGDKLAEYLKKLSISELSELHQIANFFVCLGIRKLVAAATACFFYFDPTYEGYTKKMKQFGISSLPTILQIKTYQQKLSSM